MNTPSSYHNSLRLLILSCFLLASFIQPALANKTNAHIFSGQKIQFVITESQNIPNDKVLVTFNYVTEGTSAQEVANEVNTKMQAALRSLKPYPNITTQTTQYNIHPVYKNRILSHWRGQQNLVLTLQNLPGLVKILTKVQPYLAYQSMQFTVSNTLKQQTLATLTQQAILRFRKQAKQIAHGFSANSYRILETHINTPNTNRPVYTRSEMAMSTTPLAAPAMAAGQSTLTVTVSGTIQLEP